MGSSHSTRDSVDFSALSGYFLAVEEAAESIRWLLHENGEAIGSRNSGSARYADSIATTVLELCRHGRKASAAEAIEIAEMLPKLLRALWTEIDALLERKQTGAW